MSIFESVDYKDFTRKKLAGMPQRGRGQFRKMAEFLRVNPVNISQVFRGDRDLTPEQACQLGDFFGFTEIESKYFVFMVEKARAGTPKLKDMIEGRLKELRRDSKDLKKRLPVAAELSEEKRAIFYSRWLYSGVRLLTSIEGYQSLEAIAAYFRISVAETRRILSFLVDNGLCKEEGGQYRMGPASTHLSASSPHIYRHHANWRQKSVEQMERATGEDLRLSMPCSLSPKAMKEIRKELVDTIERVTKIIDAAPCDQLACVNIDLFRL